MTYGELIVGLANEAQRLRGSAIKVLLKLVSMGIEDGSCEIRASVRWLAYELRMSKETTAQALRDIRHLVSIQAGDGITATFLLPADWIGSQRTLFANQATGEYRAKRPGNQDTTVLETRTPLSQNPGQYRPGNQDAPSWNPGQHVEKPGHSVLETRTAVLETRTVHTQNQQLTDDGRSIESTEGLSSIEAVLLLLHRIARADRVAPNQEKDAATLRHFLTAFMEQFGPAGLGKTPPDEKILARCLAIAPIDTLLDHLQELGKQTKHRPRKYGWFVAVLTNRIHNIPPDQTINFLREHFSKKQPQSTDQRGFGLQLLQETGNAVRRMR